MTMGEGYVLGYWRDQLGQEGPNESYQGTCTEGVLDSVVPDNNLKTTYTSDCLLVCGKLHNLTSYT